jgi:hypothetical protein
VIINIYLVNAIEINKKEKRKSPTALNRTVYASPPVGGSGYVLARSFRYASFPRQNSATFLRLLKRFAVSLSQPQKRRKQPERYTPFAQNDV